MFKDFRQIIEQTFSYFIVAILIDVIMLFWLLGFTDFHFEKVVLYHVVLFCFNLLIFKLYGNFSAMEDLGDVILYLIISFIAPLPHILYSMFCIMLTHDTVREWRYRGYVFPTNKNRTTYMYKLLSGEVKEEVPDDFL